MRISSILRVIALTLVTITFALVLSACGGGRKHSVNPPSIGSGGFQAAEGVGSLEAAPPTEVSLDDALTELDAYPCPEGVDPALWVELKDALREALDQRFSPLTPNPSSLTPAKLVSTPPIGDENRVTDLELIEDGGAFTLTWHYRNLGDYDQNGTVGISDITPIAIHYGEDVPEGDSERNSIQAVVDGSENDKVDIADITPIAMYYGTCCAEYSIRSALSYPESIEETSEIDTAPIALAEGDDRKTFAVGLPESEYRYFAVAPFDSDGELGELSNVVYLPPPSPNQPPVAELSANPASGDAPLEVNFDASGSNDPDGTIVQYDYDWEGDGDYDLTKGDDNPVSHIYNDAGLTVEYNATVRVTDDDGAQATDSVTITVNSVSVNESPVAELSADPTSGDAPLEVNFDASASTDSDGEIVSYEWDWEGDGTYDDTTTEPINSYTYESPGTYDATVRVADDQDATDTDYVTITVNEAGGGRGDWWMFGREPTHNRRSPYVGPQTATLQWRYQTGDLVYSSPAIAEDGTIYVGSRDNYLYALTPDGDLKWRYETGGLVDSSPAIGADGTIYVGSWDYYLHAINPDDGSLQWRYQTESIVYSSPAIGADGTIYLGGWDHYLYAINSDETLQWRYETGDAVFSSPAIGADGTVYVGSYDNYLYALTPDGDLKWRYQTGGLVDSSPAIGADGTIYVGSWDYYLHAINPDDGSLQWQYETGDGVFSPAIAEDGTIYVGSRDNYLYALTPDGDLKWRYETGGYVFPSPAIGADGTIYVGNWDNYLYALNPDGTFKWRYQTESYVFSSPAIGADGTVYVGSYDNYLYAFHD